MTRAARLTNALNLTYRQLSRAPGFSALMILIIALGPGTNTATWWDPQGAKHPIVATQAADGSSLTALWGDS